MGMSIEEYKKIVLREDDFKYKDVKRQIQGKINRELGKNFEEQVEMIAEVYRLNNLAIIEKTPEPMKILKHLEKGRFEAIFTKSAQPDFKGLIKGGRTVVFDAKFTGSDRIAYQVLSDYQREILIKYKELGAISFVLVGFSDGNIYKIDIDTWVDMKEIFGHKYIKQIELEENNLRVRKTKKGMLDFLDIC